VLGSDRATTRAPNGRTLAAPLRRGAPQGLRVVLDVRRPGGWRSWGGVVVGAVP
jgi:hypothetical protein